MDDGNITVGVDGVGNVIIHIGTHVTLSVGADRARWIAQDLNLCAYRAEVVRGGQPPAVKTGIAQ